MPHIRYIPLPLVKVPRHINDAPIGTLLQIATGDLTQGAPGISPIAVGMRSQLQAANGPSDEIVLLEDAAAGVFVSTVQLPDRPVIDLEEISEIGVHDPTPDGPIKIGDVCLAAWSSTHVLCMAVGAYPAPAALVGYALLNGAQKGHIENVIQQFRIGRAAVRQRKSDDP